MIEHLSKDDLVKMIFVLADDMIAAKDYLGELDSAIGDGDLGVTMTLGFQAIKKELTDPKDMTLAEVLSNSGMAFADNAASTFGALMATMFTRAAKIVKEKDVIAVGDGAAMLRAAAEGVKKRGKAELGDKTVLDALFPACDAYEKSFSEGGNLSESVEAALQAAQKGAEDTVEMRSRAGRSGWLGDRTMGAKDPGAAAFVLILESINKYIKD